MDSAVFDSYCIEDENSMTSNCLATYESAVTDDSKSTILASNTVNLSNASAHLKAEKHGGMIEHNDPNVVPRYTKRLPTAADSVMMMSARLPDLDYDIQNGFSQRLSTPEALPNRMDSDIFDSFCNENENIMNSKRLEEPGLFDDSKSAVLASNRVKTSEEASLTSSEHLKLGHGGLLQHIDPDFMPRHPKRLPTADSVALSSFGLADFDHDNQYTYPQRLSTAETFPSITDSAIFDSFCNNDDNPMTSKRLATTCKSGMLDDSKAAVLASNGIKSIKQPSLHASEHLKLEHGGMLEHSDPDVIPQRPMRLATASGSLASSSVGLADFDHDNQYGYPQRLSTAERFPSITDSAIFDSFCNEDENTLTSKCLATMGESGILDDLKATVHASNRVKPNEKNASLNVSEHLKLEHVGMLENSDPDTMPRRPIRLPTASGSLVASALGLTNGDYGNQAWYPQRLLTGETFPSIMDSDIFDSFCKEDDNTMAYESRILDDSKSTVLASSRAKSSIEPSLNVSEHLKLEHGGMLEHSDPDVMPRHPKRLPTATGSVTSSSVVLADLDYNNQNGYPQRLSTAETFPSIMDSAVFDQFTNEDENAMKSNEQATTYEPGSFKKSDDSNSSVDANSVKAVKEPAMNVSEHLKLEHSGMLGQSDPDLNPRHPERLRTASGSMASTFLGSTVDSFPSIMDSAMFDGLCNDDEHAMISKPFATTYESSSFNSFNDSKTSIVDANSIKSVEELTLNVSQRLKLEHSGLLQHSDPDLIPKYPTRLPTADSFCPR